MIHALARLLAALVATLALCGSAAAAGAIRGQVTDEDDLALPGALVTVSSPNLMGTQQRTTDDEGRYWFADLPPGIYKIRAEKKGFRAVTWTELPVEEGRALILNVKLVWDMAPPPDPVEDWAAVYYAPRLAVQADGELRYIASSTPDLQSVAHDPRLRASAAAGGERWALRAQGDLDALGSGGFVPRMAAGQLRLEQGLAEAGLVTPRWGLGMLVNDGAEDPWFGQADRGDRALRLGLSGSPFFLSPPLDIAVAAERIVEDELVRTADGQAAWQASASALLGWPEEVLGIYASFRGQDGETRLGVADFYTEGDFCSPRLRGGLEAASVFGETSGLPTRAFGAAGYLSAEGREDVATLILRGGWASGDADPGDGRFRAFTFDRNFEAGMLLFDALAVEAAAFLQPAAEIRPARRVALRLGALAAWAATPSPGAGRRLGAEVDWAARLEAPTIRTPRILFDPDLLLQGGHLWPADESEAETLLRATARVQW